MWQFHVCMPLSAHIPFRLHLRFSDLAFLRFERDHQFDCWHIGKKKITLWKLNISLIYLSERVNEWMSDCIEIAWIVSNDLSQRLQHTRTHTNLTESKEKVITMNKVR